MKVQIGTIPIYSFYFGGFPKVEDEHLEILDSFDLRCQTHFHKNHSFFRWFSICCLFTKNY